MGYPCDWSQGNREEYNPVPASLRCTNGGKHGYYGVLGGFYNWLYSPKSGYSLNPQDNPILNVDAPKLQKMILPSLTAEQVEGLIAKVDNLRERTIISLLADSGMRLNEPANIKANDIDWDSYTITIIGKDNKQRRAPFTEKTASLWRTHLTDNYKISGSIWGMRRGGIETMLNRLSQNTGIKFNAHSFRRGFASNLHRKGLSTLDIMHLGGWEDLSMVLRYTRGIVFKDCRNTIEK